MYTQLFFFTHLGLCFFPASQLFFLACGKSFSQLLFSYFASRYRSLMVFQRSIGLTLLMPSMALNRKGVTRYRCSLYILSSAKASKNIYSLEKSPTLSDSQCSSLELDTNASYDASEDFGCSMGKLACLQWNIVLIFFTGTSWFWLSLLAIFLVTVLPPLGSPQCFSFYGCCLPHSM
jgi:hypothetical protein